jgi:uncharacterized SAM-binding protein YcdF (DUF218 family)
MRSVRKKRRATTWAAVSGVAIVAGIAAWRPVQNAGPALIVRQGIGVPEAIIMLASHEWERLPAAAAEAREYPKAAVLITRPRVVTAYNCFRCDERVAWLQSEGVDDARIHVLDGNITNTFAEAEAARAYAAKTRIASLLIVTSPYHTRRALETFETVFAGTGVHIGVVPAAGSRANPKQWWRSSYDRHYVMYEWAASLKNRLEHGVPVLRD